MEEFLYWLIEYGKVFMGYGCLMFLWPMIMFRKFLSGKSVTFRFCFCVTEQVVLINTVVLFLGLLHILNEWTLRLVFYGPLLYVLRDYCLPTAERRKKLRYLVNGTLGWKNFLLQEKNKLVLIIGKYLKRLGRFYKKHWLEYSLLLMALVYGMIYFSWGAFHERSYGFSDIIVHHSWIYELSQGIPFSDGIYPEGMHCVVYALNALFDLRIYSCLLFVSLANLVVLLLTLYCFFKELFQWRFCAVIALAVILTFGEVGNFIILGMARVQCSLPQEFAFPGAYVCTLYLLRFLKGERRILIKGKRTKQCWNEDLLVFMLGLASTIVIHFYTTIMTFFLCVGVAVFLWRRIFAKGHFVPLVTATVIGVVVAITPMAAGYVAGIPLQGSLYWAMGVMQGTSESEEIKDVTEEELVTGEMISEVIEDQNVPLEVTEPEHDDSEIAGVNLWESVLKTLYSVANRAWNYVSTICKNLYETAYLQLYEGNIAKRILAIMAGVIVTGAVGKFVFWCLEKCTKKKVWKPKYTGYFILVYSSVVYMFVYAAPDLGLPVLIDRTRICFILHTITASLMVVPIDIFLGICKKVISQGLLNVVSFGIALGSIFLIWNAGKYHGYLYFEVGRYAAAVEITNKIIEELPKNSFTIVSTTEELYQVIEYGWHEEIVDFVKSEERNNYILPTEYIFVFVEKKPIQQVHVHFFDGPAWLAEEKYSQRFGIRSVWPKYLSSEISKEAAEGVIPNYSKKSDNYTSLESRTMIESKAYEWCEKFRALYPNEMKVYYEDDNLVCYYFRQNVQSLYQLNLE